MDSNEIKEYGLSIGYDKVGITSLGCLSGYKEELTLRGDLYSYFFNMKGLILLVIKPKESRGYHV